jgi:hypothetical protein
MVQVSSQQLDLNSMGKSNNVGAHQKSNSSSLPASFASNYASNSQRISHPKGVNDKFIHQKNLLEQTEQ